MASNPPNAPDPLVTEAIAREVLEKGPRARDSAFAPGSATWTLEHAAELMTDFVQQPDVSGSSFDAKLAKQLSEVSDGARLLFVELYYLCLLPLNNFTTKTKITLLERTLALMDHPVAIPQHFVDALSHGSFNGGVAFKTRRYWQLSYLVEFAHSFLSDDLPGGIWEDPVAFRERLEATVTTSAPSQRHSLLYLAFPSFYQGIVSDQHRRLIRNAFAYVLDGPPGDMDQDLREIRGKLSEEHGSEIHFYHDPWRSAWDPAHRETVNNPDGSPRKAWRVRGAVDGADIVADWLEEGFVSLRAAQLRPIEPNTTRDELARFVSEDYSATSYASRATRLEEFHSFISRMQLDDIVAVTSEGELHLGVLAGQAQYEEDRGGLPRLRRAVDWSALPYSLDGLPADLKARLGIQQSVVEMTQQLPVLEKLLAAEISELAPLRELELPDATDALADSLNVNRSWLQECIELLRDRPQLIFYGPPGTGKTFIARHLAEHLAGDNVRLVQFHPGYSYEDFFEGFRPQPDGSFALKPGPLRKVVDAASDNLSVPYVLIIDEINRGNLAKIFGELYFLLEYRDQNVDLLYATDDDTGFTLPENVFIIGTMNTADRSIALVDAAMRRRFSFVALHPSEPPTRDVLRRWLEHEGRDPMVAELHDELNRRIDDSDFKIGPSYFMRSAVHTDGGLERTWRTAILPLLEEHHYGDGTDVVARYGLNTVRAHVDAARRVTVVGDDKS